MKNRKDSSDSLAFLSQLQRGEVVRRRVAWLGLTLCVTAMALTWLLRGNIFYYQFQTGKSVVVEIQAASGWSYTVEDGKQPGSLILQLKPDVSP